MLVDCLNDLRGGSSKGRTGIKRNSCTVCEAHSAHAKHELVWGHAPPGNF